MEPPNKRTPFQEEIEALYSEHHQFLYRAAWRITRNHEDAEDVLQTIFVKLIQREPSEDFRKNPKGYLYQAAINGAQDVLRARKNRRLADVDVEQLAIPEALAHAPRRSQIQHMLDAMETMKPHLVEVLKLRYYEELSCIEIARMTGRSLGTVFSDLSRARTELRRLMGIEEKQNETQKDDHEGSRGTFLAESPEG